jgi:phenylpropionate dioxygenase-like ring-hydroxylating dioxygenase large terminal subunit
VTPTATDATTLPYRWYSDPRVDELERDIVFRRSWQYAGHLGALDGPGTMFPVDVGGYPVVVVRDRDERLRAFLNVCRHRGTVLVSEPQRRGTIQCPYHAWTYGLDGELRGAPRSREEPGFERDRLGLQPVAVDTWGPFVFVNPDADAGPLADALGDLPERVAANGLDVDALRFDRRVPYEIRANWKVAIENYLECYHCAINHPGLVDVIDERALRTEARELRLSQFAPVNQAALAGGNGYDARGAIGRGQFHILFPATKFNVLPGQPNLSIGPVWPLAPDRCAGFLDYFFAPDAGEEFKRDLYAFDDQVGAEDTQLVEAVQRGVSSGALPHGRLLLASEDLIAAFQRRLRERVEPLLEDG